MPAAPSHRDDFFLGDALNRDCLRRLSLLEVAKNSVADHELNTVSVVRECENAVTDGLCLVPTLRRLSDQKSDFSRRCVHDRNPLSAANCTPFLPTRPRSSPATPRTPSPP